MRARFKAWLVKVLALSPVREFVRVEVGNTYSSIEDERISLFYQLSDLSEHDVKKAAGILKRIYLLDMAENAVIHGDDLVPTVLAHEAGVVVMSGVIDLLNDLPSAIQEEIEKKQRKEGSINV